jgi:CRISPR-associated protein (TIGR03984 family)
MSEAKSHSFVVEEFSLSGESPADWFTEQTKVGSGWLLAHATDGVIWGKLMSVGGKKELSLSSDAELEGIHTELDILTLEQARLFNEAGEFRVWRTENGFDARWITDGPDIDCIDQPYLLWGTDIVDVKTGFTLVRDGQEGLLHAVPGDWTHAGFDGIDRPLALIVRHYIQYDEMGQAYFAASRLVRLEETKEVKDAAKA